MLVTSICIVLLSLCRISIRGCVPLVHVAEFAHFDMTEIIKIYIMRSITVSHAENKMLLLKIQINLAKLGTHCTTRPFPIELSRGVSRRSALLPPLWLAFTMSQQLC